MHKIIDVTIVYPDGADTFWGFISGRVKKIIVDVKVLPITSDIKGDYFNDPEFRDRFCDWINTIWRERRITKSAACFKSNLSLLLFY